MGASVERLGRETRETRVAAKKLLDGERPFSLALRVVSLLSCLSRLAPSRMVICVSQAFCSTDKEKGETARSLNFCSFLLKDHQLLITSLHSQ